MPRLRPTLTPTTATTTLPSTTHTPTGPESPLPTLPPPVSDVVARGPLTPKLKPTPTTDISVTVTVTLLTPPLTTDTTVLELLATPEQPPASSPDLPRVLARGLLMPSPRLRLMLTTATTDTVMVMVMVTVMLMVMVMPAATTAMDTPTGMLVMLADITIK